MPIRNLIFDLGNVIIDLDLDASEQLIRDLVSVSVLEPKPDDLVILQDYECGRIEEALFLNHFIRKSNGKAQAIDLINGWTAMLLGIPKQRLLMLQRLMQDYRVYILSNTNETHIRWLNNHLQKDHGIDSLEAVSHGVYYSHTLGCRKPESEIYQKLVELTGCNPAESIFFDDIQENVDAANTVLFNGVVVDPSVEIVELVPEVLKSFNG